MKHAEIIRKIWTENKNTLPTQKEIAKKLNMHASRLSRFMKGHDDLRGEELMALMMELPDDLRLDCWLRIGKELKLDIVMPSPSNGGREEGTKDQRMQEIAQSLNSSVEGLRELIDSMPTVIRNAVQEIEQKMTFHEMIHHCLTDLSEEHLKTRLKDVETISRSGLSWKDFQSIINGGYPATTEQLETFVGTVDPDEKIAAEKWALVWEEERPKNGSYSSSEHLISNGY